MIEPKYQKKINHVCARTVNSRVKKEVIYVGFFRDREYSRSISNRFGRKLFLLDEMKQLLRGETVEGNYFKDLYGVDVRDKTKQKNGLNYLSWAAAWAEIKKLHPDATYTIYEEEIMVTDITHTPSKDDSKTDTEHRIERTVKRPWFDDGCTGWVKTGVTIDGIEHIEELPIMDFKNKSIKASDITSSDANKSIQRSLTKACARHGLGLYVYEGEDLPEELRETETLQTECMDLIKKKCALSEKTSTKVGETCKDILQDETGDPMACDDVEKLRGLKKKLLTIRKVV